MHASRRRGVDEEAGGVRGAFQNGSREMGSRVFEAETVEDSEAEGEKGEEHESAATRGGLGSLFADVVVGISSDPLSYRTLEMTELVAEPPEHGACAREYTFEHPLVGEHVGIAEEGSHGVVSLLVDGCHNESTGSRGALGYAFLQDTKTKD